MIGPGSTSKGRRAFWMAILFLSLFHAFLFWYGVRNPEAMVKYDRAVPRLRDARNLAKSESVAAAIDKLSGPGTILNSAGDYAWHGLVLFVAKQWTPGIQIVQLGLHVAMLVAFYHMTFLLTDDVVTARIAVLIRACIPIDLAMPHFVSSEAFSTPFLVFGIACGVAYALRGLQVRHLAGAGFCLGLSLITRGVLLAWLPVMFAYVLWLQITNRKGFVSSLIHLAILFGCIFSFTFALVGLKYFATHDAPEAHVQANFEPGNVGITNQFAHRTTDIYVLAGDREKVEKHERVKRQGGVPSVAFRDYCEAARKHPGSFIRLWVNHAMKFTFLPSNLDICRYLNLYKPDSQRSRRVDRGWRNAILTTFREMPVLVVLLLVLVAIFLGLLMLFGYGVLVALRMSIGNVKTALIMITSLPVVYLMLRCLVTGISRKREPVDFAIALFAAIGVAMLTRRSEFLENFAGANRHHKCE